ncbi:MAG: metal-dependent transcriptional regulator [Candidatus Thermoplasmatota archaeon]|jgi:DtxR family Mn-dependent transcriptional regulator|nr:metal-dependent transcriptional regulator [Candidatus Thermoplasmatota archaeon]MCL5963433.1 metal-dependent transcriptional regulator [Candidatus Thermoplasmatota archaeon]
MNLREEDYLRYIYELSLAYGATHTSQLAKILNIAQSSVVDALDHLNKKHYIVYEKRFQIILTDEGRKEALKSIRKHELAEVLLMNVLGLSWDECDDESMLMEHGITDKIAIAIERITGAKRCPHGNPIPDKNLVIGKIPDTSLLDVTGSCIIFSVVYEDKHILQFLNSVSIFPDTSLIVTGKSDNHLVVDKDNVEITIPIEIAKVIRVTQSI